MNQPLVCIIILNWNGIELTRECLRSLLNIKYLATKTIVVDNGSTDNSAVILNNEFPSVDLIALEKNFGYAGGNNIGIDYALKKHNCDFVLLLNNDTIVDEAFLNEMVSASKQNSSVGAVVPKIYYFDRPETIWYAGGRFRKICGYGTHYGVLRKDSNNFSVPKYVTFGNGCALLISRKALEKVGNLDEQFFATCEDSDYSLRLRQAGFLIAYQPRAKVWHKVSITQREGFGEWFRHYITTRGIVLLQRKHASIPLFILFLICFTIRWLGYQTLKFLIKRDFKSLIGLWRGLLDGLRSRIRFV
jgi:GT2 family glycosyltransferase